VGLHSPEAALLLTLRRYQECGRSYPCPPRGPHRDENHRQYRIASPLGGEGIEKSTNTGATQEVRVAV